MLKLLRSHFFLGFCFFTETEVRFEDVLHHFPNFDFYRIMYYFIGSNFQFSSVHFHSSPKHKGCLNYSLVSSATHRVQTIIIKEIHSTFWYALVIYNFTFSDSHKLRTFKLALLSEPHMSVDPFPFFTVPCNVTGIRIDINWVFRFMLLGVGKQVMGNLP